MNHDVTFLITIEPEINPVPLQIKSSTYTYRFLSIILFMNIYDNRGFEYVSVVDGFTNQQLGPGRLFCNWCTCTGTKGICYGIVHGILWNCL